MPLTRITFRIEGDTEYARAFETFGTEARDLSSPLKRIGHNLIQSIGEQFLTEGSFGLGRKWQPLSRAYARWKAEHFPEAADILLVATGEMRREMLNEAEAVHVFLDRLVYEPEGERAQIAYYHQFGKGHNPARRMVVLNTATRREYDRIFHTWLLGIRRGPIRAR